jgi:hypothetical protein
MRHVVRPSLKEVVKHLVRRDDNRSQPPQGRNCKLLSSERMLANIKSGATTGVELHVRLNFAACGQTMKAVVGHLSKPEQRGRVQKSRQQAKFAGTEAFQCGTAMPAPHWPLPGSGLGHGSTFAEAHAPFPVNGDGCLNDSVRFDHWG